MVKYESGCVDCGLPCLYELCSYYKIECHYCDNCGEEITRSEDEETGLCEYCCNDNQY